MKYENFTISVVERPDSKQHEGYKYLIKASGSVIGYNAFKTENGYNQWLERSNLKLVHTEDKPDTPYGLIQIFHAIGTIEEKLFWSLSEISADAVKYKDFSNGSLVDCYHMKTESGSIVFRPNSNAKEVYNPMPINEHIAYLKING
ncbi:hypothetical protein [Paenibacillus polymyxa]|uniref:hypothetical protein n=1 Tax=Paenibacillus polymyxa TaxID=1406 RepID=UPI0006573F4D|nr:hypothetical protein [Paenibacillus polymyxa]WPQ59913.1 hypothetical protein SKN87_27095 [Paenibacillus polymyxa]